MPCFVPNKRYYERLGFVSSNKISVLGLGVFDLRDIFMPVDYFLHSHFVPVLSV